MRFQPEFFLKLTCNSDVKTCALQAVYDVYQERQGKLSAVNISKVLQVLET